MTMSQRKSRRLTVKLGSIEFKRMDEDAKAQGLRWSEYVRKLIMESSSGMK